MLPKPQSENFEQVSTTTTTLKMAGSQQLDDATEISSAELKELTPKRASTAPASFPTSTADLQPMLEALRLKAMPSFNQAASFVREQVATAGLRLQQDTLFSTLEDFERVDPDAKRIVVIGVTGAGKSTVLNCMGGWGFVQKPPDYEFEWQEKDGVSPLFEARADCDSCTKKTSFANLSFLGDAERPVVAVDTPGHDDPAGAEIENKEAREKLGEMAADLHNKMKALGHIHAILVLHNDVHSNRLNPATYTVLKMIGEKFAKAEVAPPSPLSPGPRPRPHPHPRPHPRLNPRNQPYPRLHPRAGVVLEARGGGLLQVQRPRDLMALGPRQEEEGPAGGDPEQGGDVRPRRARDRARRRLHRPRTARGHGGGQQRRLRGAVEIRAGGRAARHEHPAAFRGRGCQVAEDHRCQG